MARAMELNETISYDGSDFRLIDDGTWPFTVKAVSIEQYKGSQNIPPCLMAKVTLHVGVGANTTDVTDNIYLYYNDNGNPNWRISAFYRAIGYKKHGQEVQMNWDAGFLVGKTGWVETKQREFTFTQGARKGEKGTSIDVDRYIDPEDAPADGQPIIKGQQAKPQMPAPVVAQPIQQPTYQPQPQFTAPQPTVTAPQTNVYGGGQWAGL